MNSNTACVCCGKKRSRGNKRPVIMKALLIFVSARLFPSNVPDNSFICNTCRWMYNKWVLHHDLHKILSYMDTSSENDRKMGKKYEKSNQDLSDSSRMNSDDEDVRLLCVY